MTCLLCSDNPENVCMFSLDIALDGIRKHFKMFQTKLLEKDKKINTLKQHNKRLLKAVNLMQRTNTSSELFDSFKDSRISHTQSCNNSDFDVAFVDDDDIILDTVKDEELLDNTGLNTTQNEIISDTEKPSSSLLRRGKQQKSQISDNSRKSHELTQLTNTLNDRLSSEPFDINTKISQSKNVSNDLNANKDEGLNFMDLIRKKSIEAQNRGNKSPSLSLTLRKTKNSVPKDVNFPENANTSDLNHTTTFCFTDTMLENSPHKETESFFNYSNMDSSVIPIPTSVPTTICLDDTSEEREEDELGQHKKIAENNKKLLDERSKKSCVFNTTMIKNQTRNRTNSPNVPFKIKKEPNTQQQFEFKPNNPLFVQTESLNKFHEPMNQFIKPEPIEDDVNNVNCEHCRNRNRHKCQCKNNEEYENFVHETPEGFWNPLLLSFEANDPRNEVLIDNRFVENKKRKHPM